MSFEHVRRSECCNAIVSSDWEDIKHCTKCGKALLDKPVIIKQEPKRKDIDDEDMPYHYDEPEQ